MKIFASLVFCLCIAEIVSAQRAESVPSSGECPQLASSSARGFDVQRYRLFMDWRLPLDSMNWRFHGVNEISARIDTALSSMLLDGKGMAIDTVRVNGVACVTTQPDANGEFTVTLDHSRNAADTVDVAIAYTRNTLQKSGITYTPDAIPGPGLFLYNKNLYVGNSAWGDSVRLPDRMVYTMSEARDAPWWMPCKDDPSDKAVCEIRVLVPAGYQVSSNGRLQSSNTSTAGTTWYWKEDEPLATYLMCATASKFAMWSDNYVRVTNPLDTVPIMYFTYHADSSSTDLSGRQYNATLSFRNLPKIMAGYSSRFGEYPFSKYGMTPVQPFTYGGMEHQTQTTINRVWLRNQNEMQIAHELTHQWFGDEVTCATWKDPWLNESFATFGEAIYSEIMGGASAYTATVAQQATDYLTSGSNNISIYDPEGQGLIWYYGPTVYRKGGVVLHMLRRMLGDSVFYKALRDYQSLHHFSSANTDDFADAISRSTGQDLHWFVDEWVYGHYHPVYGVDATAIYSDVKPDRVDFTITQLNRPSRPLFRMPIVLRLYSKSGNTDTVVVDSSDTQQFTIPILPVGRVIDSVGFDPDNSILKDPTTLTFTVNSTRVADATTPENPTMKLSVSPNPVMGRAMLMYSSSSTIHGTLDIVDMLGREVAVFPVRGNLSGSIALDAKSISAGTYLARLTTSFGAAHMLLRVIH